MLWLALLTRSTRVPASERLRISDPIAALSFDFAVAERIHRLERDERQNLAEKIAIEIRKMLFGDEGIEIAEDADPTTAEILAQDKFADANTTVW